jgi:hypothetical protein
MQAGTLVVSRLLVALLAVSSFAVAARAQDARTLAGVVVTQKGELVPNATVSVKVAGEDRSTTTGDDGRFSLGIPDGPVTVRIAGENILTLERSIPSGEPVDNLRFAIEYTVPPVHESIVIVDTTLDPGIDRRNEEVYRSTLFSRDDQIFHTLAAGINVGQHEGGGKSLEVRRFGFNLDHGGVNGGLKVLVDDVQQNHGTQGHGQGYLGQLKSLSPELVKEVNIVNGPFSAQYGDFSGLGVVHIQLRESLSDRVLLRLQGGSFDTFRSFVSYSPKLERDSAFIAYEGSRTDGPFLNPLGYERDNVTANYTWKIAENRALGFKLNYGRNDYRSSARLPLDLIAENRLDRFGFLDPDNGGRVDSGTFGVYYR